MAVFYNPCNDLAFKKIFLEHPDRTISFLNAVLKLQGDRRIQSVEFLPQELLPLIEESKKSILDVRVMDHRKFQYIVEVQTSYMSAHLSRIQYYTSHAYAGQMKRAGEYHCLKPVTVLSILNHTLFPDDVPYLSFHQNMETHTGESYLNDMAYVFVELPKFKLSLDQVSTPEDYWIFLFKEAKNLTSIPENIPAEIKSALEVLGEHNWSDPEREAYFRFNMAMMDEREKMRSSIEKGLKEGLEKGWQKGHAKGREEGEKRGMIKAFHTMGLSDSHIAQKLGLSEDYVTQILAS